MAVAIKGTCERDSLESSLNVVRIGRNDRPVEDFAAGEVGIQVDVGGQDKVLVVTLRRLAEGSP